jgi:hypothetical protein
MRREIAEGMMVPGKLRSEYQKNEMRQGVPSVDYQLVGEQSAKKESSPSPIRTNLSKGFTMPLNDATCGTASQFR